MFTNNNNNNNSGSSRGRTMHEPCWRVKIGKVHADRLITGYISRLHNAGMNERDVVAYLPDRGFFFCTSTLLLPSSFPFRSAYRVTLEQHWR